MKIIVQFAVNVSRFCVFRFHGIFSRSHCSAQLPLLHALIFYHLFCRCMHGTSVFFFIPTVRCTHWLAFHSYFAAIFQIISAGIFIECFSLSLNLTISTGNSNRKIRFHLFSFVPWQFECFRSSGTTFYPYSTPENLYR